MKTSPPQTPRSSRKTFPRKRKSYRGATWCWMPRCRGNLPCFPMSGSRCVWEKKISLKTINLTSIWYKHFFIVQYFCCRCSKIKWKYKNRFENRILFIILFNIFYIIFFLIVLKIVRQDGTNVGSERVLNISALTREQGGVYNIKVSNSEGSTQRNVTVRVQCE